MRKVFALLLTVTFLVSFVGSVQAVDFQEELKKLAEDNAKGYIGPFSTAFGTAMNSGFYHTAKPHGILGFDISVKMSLVTVPTDAQVFDFMMPIVAVPAPGLGIPNDTLNVNTNPIYPNRETPTVFGEDEAAVLTPDPAGVDQALDDALLEAGVDPATIPAAVRAQMVNQINAFAMPITTVPGIGIDMMPLAMPQVSVGLPMHTEVLLRFMPAVEAGDLGEVSFLGLGLKHSISQYIPLFPVNITGQFVWQQLKIGDLLESKHTAFNVHASKKFGIGISITPYVGLGMETSTLDVAYDIEGTGSAMDGTRVEFNLDGDNGFRMTGGVRLGLAIFTLNADYSIGEYNCASVGLGLTLR